MIQSLLIRLPPGRGEPSVAVVVVAVPAEEDDEDQNCAACERGGDVVMKMKAHQHGDAL